MSATTATSNVLSFSQCPVQFGFALPENLSMVENDPEFEYKLGSLDGVNLNVGVIEGGDFRYDCSSSIKGGQPQSEDTYSNFLLSILQEVLRFEITYVSSTRWGFHEDLNRPHTGLAGLLASNVTDVLGCHRTVSRCEDDISDFLFPSLETTESFVYVPQNLPLKEDVFVAVLSRKLWLFFFFVIFLLVVSFWFSTFLHSCARPDHEPWSWIEVALWAVAAVSQQSYARHPRGSSCRTTFLIGYLIAYLLFTGFAAGVTSLLSLRGHWNPLTFGDVAELKLNLVLHRSDYYKNSLELSRPQFKDLNIEKEEGYTLDEIFHKINQNNILGLGSTVALLHYIRSRIPPENRDKFVVVPVPNSVRRKGFLTRKFASFKRVFNYWLLRLKEHGLMSLGQRRYLDTNEADESKPAKWVGVGLGNVFSAFVLLFLGWLLSFLILFLEILLAKKPDILQYFHSH